LLLLCPGPALAQAQPGDSARSDSVRVDSARVTYRTAEIVFFAAGRGEGVRVGDTVTVMGAGAAVVARAVVVSAALHTSSARLPDPDAVVAVGQFVRFAVHPEAPPADTTVALVPSADTAPPPDTTAEAPAPPLGSAPRALRRASGGLQLEQFASSTGASSALTSYQSVGTLYLDAPFLPGVALRTRVSGRWRSGASGRTTGLDGFRAIPYEVQLRLGGPDAGWNASLGRFVPREAVGLGYLDGALLEVRVAPQQRLGVVAGFVPEVTRLSFSTSTKRGGAYWAFGGAGAFAGSVAAAADWSQGTRRRTLLASQSYWRIRGSFTLSGSAEVDLGTPGGTVHGTQLTNGYLNLRSDLPLGFRGSVGLESHQAIRLWETFLTGDTLPLPGRLNGVSASLGRDLLGFRADLSGGVLKGATDAAPTYRGTLTLARSAFYLLATGQHGDLFDYGVVSARWILPYRALGFNASLGTSAAMTRTTGGAVTQWRFSVQPELSGALGGGLFASLGGDIGSFAGRSNAFLHAGVSYHFR
jgi:hypothetical protein